MIGKPLRNPLASNISSRHATDHERCKPDEHQWVFGHFGRSKRRESETIAMLPGGWDLAHAIRLGIKPFAELGANSEALSGSQVDSPCSCRAIFESAPVAMLQSLEIRTYLGVSPMKTVQSRVTGAI